VQEWPSPRLERRFGVKHFFSLLHLLIRGVASLFRRFAVEVLVVGLRIVAGMVDDSVAMIRRSIERVEFQRNTTGIDDVVICPSRDDYEMDVGSTSIIIMVWTARVRMGNRCRLPG
jgi:hypothetical protein